MCNRRWYTAVHYYVILILFKGLVSCLGKTFKFRQKSSPYYKFSLQTHASKIHASCFLDEKTLILEQKWEVFTYQRQLIGRILETPVAAFSKLYSDSKLQLHFHYEHT